MYLVKKNLNNSLGVEEVEKGSPINQPCFALLRQAQHEREFLKLKR